MHTTQDQTSRIRVAVTQAEPEWLDLDGSTQKTCRIIEEAAANGARLVTFPECWIPGYPAWVWSRSVDFAMSTEYTKNCLKTDSPQMRLICASAAKNKIAVALGFAENHKNSLYISQALLGADGKVEMLRRKFKPTHMERTVFGDASGGSLRNVIPIPDVGRVGSLACWEHTQPLLKYHTCLQNEDIHVAAWPPLFEHTGGPDLWSMSRQGCRGLSQTYAIESQAFVLHTTAVFSEKGIKRMNTASGMILNMPGGGSSAVFGPDGRKLTDDIPETEEGIIYADLDLDDVIKAKSFIDVCGHYSRPDMLWLGVDDREKKHLRPHGE